RRTRSGGGDGTASGPDGAIGASRDGTNRDCPLAILPERGRTARRMPRGPMQRDLVERARRGDHDAFAALAGAAISRLDGAARLTLRTTDKARDAVQTALARAWRDLPPLRDPDRFDAWLNRLLVRSCIDEARRLRRHRVDVELTEISLPAAV